MFCLNQFWQGLGQAFVQTTALATTVGGSPKLGGHTQECAWQRERLRSGIIPECVRVCFYVGFCLRSCKG